MRARGDWRWKIAIKETTGATKNDYGEFTGGSENTHADRWAKKEYGGAGTENVEAARESQIQTIKWTTDYISGLTVDMWLEDSDGTEYDIINTQEVFEGNYHLHVIHTKLRQ